MINQVSPNTKTQTGENFNPRLILRGILVSYLITIPLLFIFALILTNTNFPEKYTDTAVTLTTIISILVAGSSVTRGARNKGWLNGGLVGLIYMLVLYLVSSIVFKNFCIDRHVLTMLLIGILTGAIGGIIGINLRSSAHKAKSKYKR